jgi:hypothetical protein
MALIHTSTPTTSMPVVEKLHFQCYRIMDESILPAEMVLHTINVHMPNISSYNTSYRNTVWDELEQTVQKYGAMGHLIIAGDFNASSFGHHDSQPPNSKRLLSMCTTFRLVNLSHSFNDRRHTHRPRHGSRNTRLDHILCDCSLAQLVTYHHTYPLQSVPTDWSDHSPVKATFTFPTGTTFISRRPPPRISWRPAAATLFGDTFTSRTSELSQIASHASTGDIDKALSLLNSTLWSCASTCKLIKSGKTSKHRVKSTMAALGLSSSARAARTLVLSLKRQRHPRADPQAIKQAAKAFRKEVRRHIALKAYQKSASLLSLTNTNPGKFWRQWDPRLQNSATLIKPRTK